MKNNFYKNWSYVQMYNKYLDGINNILNVLTPINNDINNCSIDELKLNNNNLQLFVQKEWKIALTTPTITYNNQLYGVIHIRIQWNDISFNYNNISPLLKKIIKKNDVHLNDFYFMSIYKIKCADNKCPIKNIKLSNPFLITGDVSNEYYSYNINFPCGIHIANNNISIEFGLGDCIFMKSDITLQSIKFYTKQFDYNDLEVYTFKDDIIEKQPIITKLNCLTTIKYILPKHMFLFDLGGSGLKVVEYSFGKFSKQINLGWWNNPSLPNLDIMVKRYIDYFNMYNGIYLLFSLASINKIWNKDNENNENIKSIYQDKYYYNMHNLFNIPEHIPILQISDSIAHYYGNKSELDLYYKTVIKTTIMSITIGTGINITVGKDHTFVKPTKDSIWKLTYKNINIRDVFLNIKSLPELKDILKFIKQQVYSNIDIDYVIFSGGKINETYINKLPFMMSEETLNLHKVPDINIFFNSDKLNPYNGLITKLSIDKNFYF